MLNIVDDEVFIEHVYPSWYYNKTWCPVWHSSIHNPHFRMSTVTLPLTFWLSGRIYLNVALESCTLRVILEGGGVICRDEGTVWRGWLRLLPHHCPTVRYRSKTQQERT